MTCRSFRDRWNDLLDARSAPPAGLELELETHASACPACAATSARYRLLYRAIEGLRPPVPSAASVERLARLTVPLASPTIPIVRPRSRARRLAPLVATAAALVLAWWSPGGHLARRAAPPEPAATPGRAAPSRPLGLALLEATEATLDLAREASAPASRIGREMIDLGRLTTSGLDLPVDLGDPAPAPTEPELPPAGLFRAVGERVGAGVRPLSGSARHAFGFLLGSPAETAPDPRDGL